MAGLGPEVAAQLASVPRGNTQKHVNRDVLAYLHQLEQTQRWGRVVTITSFHGREGGGRPWFNMAKTAETALMKNLAMNPALARDGIVFTSVAPGCVMIPDTGWDAERKKDPVAFQQMTDVRFPLGRLGTPEEVADVVAFACSARASLLGGAAIAVDGAESRAF